MLKALSGFTFNLGFSRVRPALGSGFYPETVFPFKQMLVFAKTPLVRHDAAFTE